MTRDHARQALVALGVYLERGETALRSLESGDPDGAALVLAKRSAAFHNFRALDHLARQNGQDLGADPEAQTLWAKIFDLERRLVPKLEDARERALGLTTKVREARTKLARFHSGGTPSDPQRGNGFSKGA